MKDIFLVLPSIPMRLSILQANISITLCIAKIILHFYKGVGLQSKTIHILFIKHMYKQSDCNMKTCA